ncbi:MAG: metallophosphoesterase [Chroococcales cyanobacterium]
MKTLKYLLFGIGGIILIGIIWGLIEPYFLDTEEQVAVIPNLPESWEGKRVAQISDLQIGMWLDNDPTVRDSIEDIIEERPNLVLISGDFIYHALDNPDPKISDVVNYVRPLTEAGIPTYAVLGNHDYSVTSRDQDAKEELANQLETALEEIGIPVLQNEAVSLASPENGNDSLYLVGIGSYVAQKSDPQKALAGVPDNSPRIVMMHNPDTFASIPPNAAPFSVAGHTHGGQIRVPFSPEWSWMNLVTEGEVHADGWIPDYGAEGNELYVNRGIGFSVLPIRINCPPEVTYFTLESQ